MRPILYSKLFKPFRPVLFVLPIVCWIIYINNRKVWREKHEFEGYLVGSRVKYIYQTTSRLEYKL